MNARALRVLLPLTLAGCGSTERDARRAERTPAPAAPLAVAPAPDGAPLQVRPAVRLAGNVEDLLGARDGSIRAVTTPLSTKTARLTSLGPSWTTRRRPNQDLPQAAFGDRDTFAITRAGVLSVRRSTTDRLHRITATDDRRDGTRSPARPISTGARSASEPQAVAGGDAVAALWTERRRGSERRMFAYRPAGSAAFGAPVALDPATDDGLAAYEAVLAPDGSGAVAGGIAYTEGRAHVRARRIDRDGTLGPWVPIADSPSDEGSVSVAAGTDGTIGIAMTLGSNTSSDGTLTLKTSSLPPGSGAPTPPQVLSTDAEIDALEGSLSLAVGPSGQTVLTAAGLTPGHIDVFTGPADDLTRTGTFPAEDPTNTLATATADGGATVVWSGGTSDDGGGPLLASHRPPRGVFSKPVTAGRTHFKGTFGESGPAAPEGISTTDLVPVGATGAALVYQDAYTFNYGPNGEGFRTYLVRLQP